MARNDFFAHTGSDGSEPSERVTDTGYSWFITGENITAGSKSVGDVYNNWASSFYHRQNMMNPEFTEIGLAYAKIIDSEYEYYWTLILADRRDEIVIPSCDSLGY